MLLVCSPFKHTTHTVRLEKTTTSYTRRRLHSACVWKNDDMRVLVSGISQTLVGSVSRLPATGTILRPVVTNECTPYKSRCPARYSAGYYALRSDCYGIRGAVVEMRNILTEMAAAETEARRNEEVSCLLNSPHVCLGDVPINFDITDQYVPVLSSHDQLQVIFVGFLFVHPYQDVCWVSIVNIFKWTSRMKAVTH